MDSNTIKDKIIKDLDANFKKGDELIIEDYIEFYSSIASDNSNRNKNDKLLYPYIFEAVKSAYGRRGNEGVSSSNESGFSISYIDIVDKLKKDVKSIRVLP